MMVGYLRVQRGNHALRQMRSALVCPAAPRHLRKAPAQGRPRTAAGPRLIAANPSVVVAGLSGGTVTVSGDGFPVSSEIAVWFDANGNGTFDQRERLLLTTPGVGASVPTDAAGAFTGNFAFAADVAAGMYSIRAGACVVAGCIGTVGTASTPVTVAMGISHSKFGGGSTLTVTGAGFPAATSINVWYDTNPNGMLAGTAPAVATTDASGAFSVPLVVNGASSLDALFAAFTSHAGVAAVGPFFVHAGPALTAQRTVAVEIGSCWFNECLIYDSFGDAADTLCLFGNSPQDNFAYFSDCKALDVNYSSSPTGYNFTNTGPVFLGAGVLAAALNDLGPPGTGCAQLTAAIVAAEAGYGNSVPDKVSLLAIACGTPLSPPLDLGLYIGPLEFFGNHVPDKGVIFAAVAAINATAFTAGAVVAAASVGALAAGPLIGPIVGAAASAATASGGVGPATASAIGATVGVSVLGAIATLGFVGGAVAPLVTPAILLAAQYAVAQATVAGAIACGYVNYYCFGADITANLLAHPALQTQRVPVPFLQPPFKAAPSPNPCRGVSGTCWGSIIGWSKAVCTSQVVGSCGLPDSTGAFPMLAIPGSAGANNEDPTAGPIRCAVGKVIGLSIGYDGDIAFSVDSPSTRPLTNYHNFLPGPGGTDAPNGIDIEIPIRNPLGDPALMVSSAFLPVLVQLRTGMEVKACGHWVADMHMLWNELHPLTSLSIAPDFTLGAIPGDLTIQSGETGVFAITATLLSGPASPVTLSVISGPPGSFSAGVVTVAPGAPATSTLTLSGVPLGDHEIVVQGESPEGVIRTAAVNLHVYDYGIQVSPSNRTVLRGGAGVYTVIARLLAGSSETNLPAITLSPAGLPGDALASSPSWSVVPTPAGIITPLSVATAAGGSLGDFAFTLVGRNPSGTTRTSDPPAMLHIYDFTVAAAPSSLQILTTGANFFQIAIAPVAGSSTQGLPSIGLSDTGLPANTSGAFNPASGSPAGFGSVFAITAANAASSPGVPLVVAGTDARSPEGGSRSTAATLIILTPAQALGELIAVINATGLNHGQKNSLTTKLNHAITSLISRPPGQPTACNQLHAFVNEVNAYLSTGRLTAAEAGALLGGPLGIFSILAAIPCR